MKTLKLSILLFSIFVFGCSENDLINNIENLQNTNSDLLTPTYIVTLTVYQKANYTPNDDDNSYPVLVEVGQTTNTWYSNGTFNGDWEGFVTKPQTWQDESGGTYNTTGFKIAYNIIWTNGFEYTVGVYRIGSGNPNPIIYYNTVACSNGNGNATTYTDPASLLQVNTIYAFCVGTQYITEDNKK